jgi:hypothetical protein
MVWLALERRSSRLSMVDVPMTVDGYLCCDILPLIGNWDGLPA